MSTKPVGVLLAAGQGKRFGGNKLLHPVDNGRPMAEIAAQHLAAVLPRTIAVIDGQNPELNELLQRSGLELVINNHADKGIGSSIACAINASKEASGWVIALADMPYITIQTIKDVAGQLEQSGGIVAPMYGGQRGHPVGFDATFADELLQLDNDIGARDIIKNHPEALQVFETDDAGIVMDIDRVEDLVQD